MRHRILLSTCVVSVDIENATFDPVGSTGAGPRLRLEGVAMLTENTRMRYVNTYLRMSTTTRSLSCAYKIAVCVGSI